MRTFSLALLVGSMVMVPHTALSQESAAPTPEDFVCALVGDCGEEAEEGEAAPDAAAQPGGSPRVSATRGFSLSRPRATSPAPQGTASRPAQRPRRPVQPPGRVDLRLAFGSGSARLDADDQARVLALAEALKRPQLANVRVRIEGHTDSSGGRAINLPLSQRRAQAVADFLIGQGIAADRLEVRGYGYDRPLPGRSASAGANRRVEAVRIS